MGQRTLLTFGSEHPVIIRAVFAVLAIVLAVYTVVLAAIPTTPTLQIASTIATSAIEVVAVVLVAARVMRVERERQAWALLAVGLGALLVTDTVRAVGAQNAMPGTMPFAAHLFNLLFYGALLGCVLLVARERTKRLTLSTWLDGLICALALLAVVFFVSPRGSLSVPAETVGELVYLLPSLLYAALLIAVLSALDRRPSSAWWLNLAAALLLFASAIVFGPSVARGQAQMGTPADVLHPLAAVLLALSAWAPLPPPDARPAGFRVAVIVPAVFSSAALFVLVFNELGSGYDLVEYLAFAALAAGMARLLLAVSEADRLRRREAELARRLAAARDEALAATEAKSTFLATISHEMRTPLNAILGMNELLSNTDLDPTQREYARRAAASGSLLLDVVTDVLDFSKIEAGVVDLEPAPFDLHRLITSAVTVLSFAAESKGLALKAEYSPAVPPHVIGDVVRLRQVLINLMGNAVKFTDAGDVVVRVLPGTGDGRVRFEVADTGVGIPADALPHIFAPFTQADASRTRRHGGTGLGLSICRSLVEMMGGEIHVESEVGRGSTFWFELELERAAGVPFDEAPTPVDETGAPATTAPAPAPRVLNVLVAEDNPTLQLLAVQIVERLGHTARLATNGFEAVEAVRRDRYDIVLMDVHMPVMDGLQATREIRRAGRAVFQPHIIALTAGATIQDREECRAAGMDAYVAKPFTLKDLRRVFATEELSSTSPVGLPSRERFSGLDELGPEVKAEVLRAFVGNGAAEIAELEAAARAMSPDGIRAFAHRVRGASLALSASTLADACGALENADDAGALDARAVDAVRVAYAATVAAAERELRVLPAF